MKPAFLVTSAIRTDLGIYDAATRLRQTQATLASIRQRAPGAAVALLEMSAMPLDDDIVEQLAGHVDWYVTVSHPVLDILRAAPRSGSTLKAVTELAGLHLFLGHVARQHLFTGIDHVFKLSGRYVLTDDFEPARFSSPDRYVLKRADAGRHSSRLWAFDAALIDDARERIGRMLEECTGRLAIGADVDIGELLHRHLPETQKRCVAMLGVQGYPGALGELIIE
ncbi:MAG: hypothetical protein EOP77_03225 [Variovorax sp.]|nr:MAG: hypothetical protein EOP77_03225 [Variovorax sp.]